MKRLKKGFVLTEILATVAILIVTFSVAGVGASDIQLSLNQNKADTLARDIYLSAQNNVMKLNLSGNQEMLDNQNNLNGYVPDGYSNSDGLKYIKSSNSNSEYFVNDSTEGEWIIEYDSKRGEVVGAFWSSGNLDFYGNNELTDSLRNTNNENYIEFAKQHKFNVSYYNGETTKTSRSGIQNPEPEPDPEPEEEDTTIPGGFCYYEIYLDDNNADTPDYGYYVFGDYEKRNLQNRMVIGDGYGVLIRDKDVNKINDISFSGKNGYGENYSKRLSSCTPYLISNGVIMRFPSDMMRANWLSNEAITKKIATNQSQYNQNYYWDVTVNYGETSESWSYSPYFAKSAVALTTSKTLPSEVYIRSARQLNALSWMYSSYYNKKWAWDWKEDRVASTTFKQELDIDYKTYDFNEYTGVPFVGQLPIGTDWGRFISNYEGGYHTIWNCKFLKRNKTGTENTYAGLFGYVSLGTINAVNVDSTGGTLASNGSTINVIDDADYCGVFAAYVQNANVTNCSVNNYTINYQNPSATKNSVSTPDETKYARIGCFIGYIKSAYTNEPGSTLIDGCKVTNCTLKAKNMEHFNIGPQTTYRAYQFGGFAGSIADRQQSETYGKTVTVSNCSVQATISTSSYGLSAECAVGGFAGAKGWPKVVGCTTNVSGLTSSHNKLYYIGNGPKD